MATEGGPPFAEAIAAFRQKVPLPTKAWTDLWEGQHARAFVVAGANRDEIVADFQDAIGKALEEGRTKADFQKDFDAIVAKHGWSYKGQRGWRSETIFRTNVRSAYAAGRYEQQQRLAKRRPWLRYVATLDNRTRPEHRAWHGTLLRFDDPWWQTHYPPNGFNCRCTTFQYSDKGLESRGLKPTPAPNDGTETVRLGKGEDAPRVTVPKGVDPGFAYHPGEAVWGRSPTLVAMERHGPWTELLGPVVPEAAPELPPALPTKAKLAKPVAAGDEAALRQSLRDALGADETILADPTGTRVALGQAVVDDMLADPARQDGREAYFPLLPELVEQPDEIWIGFARSEISGRVALRRRYLRRFKVGRRTVELAADQDRGWWSGFRIGLLDKLRSGFRLWWRGMPQQGSS